mmetsp:Transcript_1243/g.1979  ORF Transcript_1243/g.1979 Transcript_1243/m.1979 type:complete len:328 (-) Transcript_1243:675-1658(-)
MLRTGSSELILCEALQLAGAGELVISRSGDVDLDGRALLDRIPADGDRLWEAGGAGLDGHKGPPLVGHLAVAHVDVGSWHGANDERAVELQPVQRDRPVEDESGASGDGDGGALGHGPEYLVGCQAEAWREGDRGLQREGQLEEAQLCPALDAHAGGAEQARIRRVDGRLPRAGRRGVHSLGVGGDCLSDRVLHGREGEPALEVGEADALFRPEQLGEVLHHALEARRLLELGLLRVRVLGVDELGHGSARRGERGRVGGEGHDERVHVARVRRVAALVRRVAALARRLQQRVELVVLDVDHQRRLRAAHELADGAGGLAGGARDGE